MWISSVLLKTKEKQFKTLFKMKIRRQSSVITVISQGRKLIIKIGPNHFWPISAVLLHHTLYF